MPLLKNGLLEKIETWHVWLSCQYTHFMSFSSKSEHDIVADQATLRYWMPIHYDTIEDGQNKKSHLLFSFLVRIVLFLYFIGGIYLSKISFHWLQLNNYTPYENKCFNPRNKIHCVTFITHMNSVCVQMRHAIRSVHLR